MTKLQWVTMGYKVRRINTLEYELIEQNWISQIGKNKFRNKFVIPMMVKNNICCFGDIIGKTYLCNESPFSKVAISAIFRFAELSQGLAAAVIRWDR